MKVAVIGAGGFIGRALVSRLANESVSVNAFTRDWQGTDVASFGGSVTLLQGDAGRLDAVRAAMRGCSIAYFLPYEGVPMSESGDHLSEYARNVQLLGTACAAAEYGGVERFVLLSSGGTVYGNRPDGPAKEDSDLRPVSHYGVIKKLSEEMLSRYATIAGTFHYVIARLGNPFGPGQMIAKRKGLIVSAMLKTLADEPVPVHNDGSQVRDYIFIDDAISALVELGRNGKAVNGVFNVGSGVGRSVAEVLGDIERITGRKLRRIPVPGRPQDVGQIVLCAHKLRAILPQWERVGYEEGLRRTWKAVLENHYCRPNG